MAEAFPLVSTSHNAESSSEHKRCFSDDYFCKFFKVLNQLRDDEAFCDVKLLVDNSTFSCHRIVLMSGSPYFYAMFMNNMIEHDQEDVIIGGVSKQIFSVILDFLYSGYINVTEDNCEDLFLAADMFSISDIVDVCSNFLQDKLQPENCIGIYLFAGNIACQRLQKHTESYIHKNFLKVVQEEEFLNLDKATLVHILNSEFLVVENEFQVFKAAIDWILHNTVKRKTHIFDVMSAIRFPIVSDSRINTFLSSLTDSEFSIKIALQKILSDFKLPKKSFGLIGLQQKAVEKHLYIPRKCARKNIYICGGFYRPKGSRWSDADTLNSVERYDTFYKTWHVCPSFQFPRSGLGAGVIDGQVCIVGGENDMLMLDSVETYDPVTAEWKCLPGLTSPRSGHGVCTIDNCLYAVCGWVGSEIGGTVEKYDSDTHKWTVISYCRSLKCWMGVASDGGLLYVVGGSNDLGDETKSVESFNPVTKEWTTLPDLNICRSYPAVTVLDECLYAIGGWNEDHGALKSVEKLDFKKGFWEEVTPLSTERAGACVVVVNNMLYVMGGRNQSLQYQAPSTLDSMEGYDPSTNTWVDLGNMLSGRCEGAAVVI